MAECCCEVKEKIDLKACDLKEKIEDKSCQLKEKIDARATGTDMLIKETEASRVREENLLLRMGVGGPGPYGFAGPYVGPVPAAGGYAYGYPGHHHGQSAQRRGLR